MRITHEEVANGEAIPRWYAVAYRDLYGDTLICYPVGIHLVVMAWEWLAWRFTRAKHYTFMRAPLRMAYHAGMRDALEQCRDETIKQIVSEALETMKQEGRP